VGSTGRKSDRRRASGLAVHPRDCLAKLGPLSGGTFRAELLDVAEGERFVVAVQHATAHRQGKRLDVTACQLVSIEDGKILSVRGPIRTNRPSKTSGPER